MRTGYGRSLMEDMLGINAAYQRVMDAVFHSAMLEYGARTERELFGRAGSATLAWLRHRPRLRGPVGRLP